MGCLAFHKKATRHSLLNALQVVNYLRYGCTPVGVTEGRPPAEKLERLQQRCFVQNLLAAETHLANAHTLQRAGFALAQDEWEAAVAITTLQRWASQLQTCCTTWYAFLS